MRLDQPESYRIALLIDADNAPASKIESLGVNSPPLGA